MTNEDKPVSQFDEKTRRFCRGRGCGYELRGLELARCPECGRPFDPDDSRTFRSRPIGYWHRYVKCAVIGSVTLLLVLAAGWGWFYYGWYAEQQSLRDLAVSPNNSNCIRYRSLLWPGMGRISFIFDRVVSVRLMGRLDLKDITPIGRLANLESLELDRTSVSDLTPLSALVCLKHLELNDALITDLTPLAGLQHLQHLEVSGTPVTDLTALAGLKELHTLDLHHTSVKGVAPLARLENLQSLDLSDTAVKDLAPLADLTQLQSLRLSNTPLTELTPLRRLDRLQSLTLSHTSVTKLATLGELTQLETLCLDHTPATDFAPVERLHSLHLLTLPSATTEAQAKALQIALPTCTIRPW